MKLTLRKCAGTICGMGAVFFLAAPFFAIEEASAFSLGQIRVTGAPDKKFRAEIPVRIDGQPGLKVSLGDGADYKRVGVSRPVFLDKLTLEVAVHPAVSNQSIIYITSSEPILAPSFNLVVKASLGGGTILENFFLALDFQKNLNLDLPVTAEERIEMDKIARELMKLKPGAEKKEPELDETDMTAMIDRTKRQERKFEREKNGIQSETITEPAPADEVRPMKVSPLQPAVRKPEPEPERAETDKVAMIEKQQQVSTPEPEPRKNIVKQPLKRSPAPKGQVIMISADDPAANVYQVERGDSLYKIAKKLGASSKDFDRVVVALWRDNFRHFIKGNIHGLYGGRKLDFSRVNETAKGISRADAKKIIMEQWPLWQDRALADSSKTVETRASASKPLVGIKAPALKLPFKSEILSVLAGWRESFEKGDMAAHMEYYSNNYENGDVTKQNLSDAKYGQGFGKGKIGVKFDDVKMIQRDSVIEVILPAVTGTDKKMAGIPHKLYFAKENGQYRIVKETGRGEAAGVTDGMKKHLPFIVHIASFKKQESAQKLVELLRKKGYNAFEVLSLIPGRGSWHRVAVSRFASISEADMFSQAIKKSGLSRYTRTLRLPYAIRIGDIVNREKVEEKIKKYLSMGFSTYNIKEGLNGKASIFLGAFDSEKSATRALALLGELKASSTVVRP